MRSSASRARDSLLARELPRRGSRGKAGSQPLRPPTGTDPRSPISFILTGRFAAIGRTPAESMSRPTESIPAVVALDGRLVLLGGQDADCKPTRSVWVLAGQDQVTRGPDLPIPVRHPNVRRISDREGRGRQLLLRRDRWRGDARFAGRGSGHGGRRARAHLPRRARPQHAGCRARVADANTPIGGRGPGPTPSVPRRTAAPRRGHQARPGRAADDARVWGPP